jgi:hypothetical protein
MMSRKEDFSQEQIDLISKYKIEGGTTFFANLRTIYGEHYKHSRHQEWQRTTFVSILGVIVAAIISSYDKLPPQYDLRVGVFAVGWALSLLGFVLMYTWNRPFIRHYTMCEIIIRYYWKLPVLSRFEISNSGTYKDKFNPSNLSLSKDFLFEPTSGNVFYSITALFSLLFSILVGYTISLAYNTPEFITVMTITISAIITIGALFYLRYIFARHEKNARENILRRFWKNPDKDNPFASLDRDVS